MSGRHKIDIFAIQQNFMKIISMRLLCALAFLTFAKTGISQNELSDLSYTFSPATVQGEIPEIYQWSKEKYLAQPFAHLSAPGTEKEKVESFRNLYRANLYSLFWSGNILFGDEYSSYLNQIKNKILDGNNLSSLKSQLHCYAWKTDEITPKTLIDGSILVPMKLIAKTESEAQLAFLISHEISTYQQIVNEQYGLFLNTTGSLSQKFGLYDILSEFNEYFEKNESKNDLGGYNLFEKTAYNQEDALDLLLIMQFSSLDFGDKKITPEFFNNKYGDLPESFFENLSTSVEGDVEEIAATKKSKLYESRIEKLGEVIDFVDGKKFIISFPERFKELSMNAKFESQLIHVENKNYIKAMNESYALLQLYPENEFLQDCIIQSLYALTKSESNFSTFKKKSSYFKSKNRSKSSSSENRNNISTQDAIESLMDNTTGKTLRYVAINYIAANGKEKHNKLANDLLYDLIHLAKEDLNEYKQEKETEEISIDSNETMVLEVPKQVLTKTEPEVKEVKFEEIDSMAYIKLSKIEKINYQRKLKKYQEYLQYLADKKMKDSLDKVVLTGDNLDSLELTAEQKDRLAEIEKNQKEVIDHNFIKSTIENWKKDKEFWSRVEEIENLDGKLNYRKHFLGISKSEQETVGKLSRKIEIDSIICEEPEYRVYDDRRLRGVVRYEEQALKNEELKKTLETSLNSHTTNSSVAFVSGNEPATIESVQTKMNISKWKQKHDFSSSDHKQFDIMSNYFSESTLNDQYKYILYTRINSERQSRSVFILAIGLVSFVAAPLAAGVFITPKYDVSKTIEVKDLQGNTVYKKTITPKQRPNVFLDRMFVNDVMNQISKK